MFRLFVRIQSERAVMLMVGVYFLFVMIMCCLELAITMLVMNLHNRATVEPLRALPPWVRYVTLRHFTAMSLLCDARLHA